MRSQRGGTAGLTPIGETYRAIFRKDSSGVVRIVITDYGSGIPSSDVRIRQAGYLKTAASLDGYKLRVADQYAKLTDGGYSGVVAANTMSARAPGGGFTQDLTAYFNSTAPTYPVAVVLVGWPEYPGGGDEGDSFNGTCSISVGQNPTCPIGSVEADRWNACSSVGYVSRTASNGVRFAFGSEQKNVKNEVPCNQTCAGPPGYHSCQSSVPATSYNEIYAVEGLRVSEVICSVEYPRNDSPSPPYSCGIQTGVWRPSWSAYYTGTIPKAILCCSGG